MTYPDGSKTESQNDETLPEVLKAKAYSTSSPKKKQKKKPKSQQNYRKPLTQQDANIHPGSSRPSETTASNPLLEKVKINGRDFTLPSRSMFYNSEEIARSAKDGDIHVYPMNAICELKIKNPDLLFSGKAFEQVIRECVPSVLHPMELFGKDIDAIMCFIRIVTYGELFTVVASHDCAKSKEHDYEFNLLEILQDMEYLDPVDYSQACQLRLPNDQLVSFTPIKMKNVIEILQSSALSASEDSSGQDLSKLEDSLFQNLQNIIDEVDGITDKKLISDWLRQIPATYIDQMGDKLASLNKWGPNFTRDVTCKDCDKNFSIELPLNPVDFFSD